MTTIVAWSQARDIARSRWLAAYALFFALVTEALLRFAGGEERTILSLASITLYVVPLVTLVFGTISLYNARELVELLLAQPVRRGTVYCGLYLGLSLPFALAVVVGIAAPFVLRGITEAGQGTTLLVLLAIAAALSLLFTAVAFCIALWTDDRLKGLALAVGAWMLCDIVYDGIVLAVVAAFADYPLERPMLALMLANPIDLARVTLLLQLDVSALMGYTGAVFQQFLGGVAGTLVAAAALALWLAGPFALGLHAFRRKDF